MDSTLALAATTLHRHRSEIITIPTADPVNFHDAMRHRGGTTRLEIEALLAVPDGDAPHPTVIVVPGSAGVSPNHVEHTGTLLDAGYAVCLVDPFGARAVTSTVANQAQYSFAASAVDVVSTLARLAERPEVDATRINAQGHSRGGAAVMMAAMRPFVRAVAGDVALRGAYAAYPWCGQQFLTPDTGDTAVRAIIGDRDEWCSVMAVQAQVRAIALCGGRASVRIVPGAHHSFDRHEPVHRIDEARVSPAAPIEYLADDGSMIDPTTGEADPDRADIDQFRYAVAAGFGQRGAAMGSRAGQPELFVEDMLDFHRTVLG